jgi:hypothetical protein
MEKFSRHNATSGIHYPVSGRVAPQVRWRILSPPYESSSIFLTGSCDDCRAAIGVADRVVQRTTRMIARSKRCSKRPFFPQLFDTIHRPSLVRVRRPHDFKDFRAKRLPVFGLRPMFRNQRTGDAIQEPSEIADFPNSRGNTGTAQI